VNARDAIALIRGAVPAGPGTWADLGAGEGTFTHALAELLGPTSVVYAVDRDAKALKRLQQEASSWPARIVTLVGDFTRPIELPELDGMLIANALHYVANPGDVLGRLAARLRLGGQVVIVEYDRRRANPWVPHPISIAQLPAMTTAAGLSAPTVIATRPSAFGGDLYVAVADRPAGRP